MILDAMIRVFSSIAGWLIGIRAAADRRKMLHAFPIGARVRLTKGCDCGRRHLGREGAIEGLSSSETDYRVTLDGCKPRDFEFVCSRGMSRIPPLN
jgi:hypothetical protein